MHICECNICGEIKECNPHKLKDYFKNKEKIEYWCKECEEDLHEQYLEDKKQFEELKREWY